MSFEKTLRQWVDQAEEKARKRFDDSASQIGEMVAEVINGRGWHNSISEHDDFEDYSEQLREAALALDAVGCLRNQVIGADRARVLDVPLDSGVDGAREMVEELVRQGEAPKRAFVYAVWRRKEGEIVFVGRSKGATLEAGSKLKQAARDADALALIFPTTGVDKKLREVQSAVVALVEAIKGDYPEHNDDAPDVPDHEGTRELEELVTFFVDVGERIDWD